MTHHGHAYQLEKKYGINVEVFEQMLADQNNCCAICHEVFTKTPCVDHHHGTQTVRALLCNNCNFGLGHFKENPRLLAAAIIYLEDHKRRGT